MILTDEVRGRLYDKGFFPITDVSFETIATLTDWILSNRPNKREFTILISSSGGSPGAVIRFASFLGTLDREVKIKGVAFDECGSAALALLQCCHERVSVKHCAFFIHHVQTRIKSNCQSPDMREIRRELKSSRRLEKELVRIQTKRTGMSRRKWMRLADEGEHGCAPILTKRALKLGLIDEVVESFPVF